MLVGSLVGEPGGESSGEPEERLFSRLGMGSSIQGAKPRRRRSDSLAGSV
jgi:hypothetical protein